MGDFRPPESGIRSWGPHTWQSSPAPVPRRAVLPPASAWWTTRWTSPMCPTCLGDVLLAFGWLRYLKNPNDGEDVEAKVFFKTGCMFLNKNLAESVCAEITWWFWGVWTKMEEHLKWCIPPYWHPVCTRTAFLIGSWQYMVSLWCQTLLLWWTSGESTKTISWK